MRKKSVLSLVLTIMVILSSFTLITFADNSREELSVEFTTDKDEYKQGEDINMGISIKNISGKDLKNIEVKNTLPEGIEFKSSEGGEKIDESTVKWKLDSLKDNESVSFKLSSSIPKYEVVVPVPVPDTGMDYFNYLIVGTILLLTSIIGYIYIKKNPRKFNRDKVTSVGMVLVMTLGVLGQSLVVADASSKNSLTITKTLKIKCDDEELENILEVKGAFIDDTDTENPAGPEDTDTENPAGPEDTDTENPVGPGDIETENPVEPDDSNSYISINGTRVNSMVVLDWDLINEAQYTIKRGETKSSLSIVEENLSENSYIDEAEDINKSYYYKVESKKESGEIKESEILEVKPFIDKDEDLLEDNRELELGTDPNNADTDGDGLLDGEEVDLYGTNPNNADTDGDGLNDAFEVLDSRTSPNKKDTDGNGVSDDEEDLDKDSLNNKKEMELGTDPLLDDTDYDNLKDNEELKLGTDPRNKDTDGDGLLDGDEIIVNLNPLKKDTDDDGVLDPDETVDYEFKNSDLDEDEDVQAKINVSTYAKNMEKIYIRNTKGDNFLTNEETPGYLGTPYYINVPKGDQTIIEFIYKGNKKHSGNLGIYFYDEVTQYLEEVTNTVSAKSVNSVSAKVDQPGEYILLDKDEQKKAWEKVIMTPSEENKKLDIVLAIDSSGSMEDNDPNELRKLESKVFVDRLIKAGLGRAAIVKFNSAAAAIQSLTDNVDKLYVAIDKIDSLGETSLSTALKISTLELERNAADNNEKYILLLTDGKHDTQTPFDYESIEYAKENNVKVYTIGLGDDIDNSLLDKIASDTGGRSLYTNTAEGLENLFEEFSGETIDRVTDTDKDGVSDYHEEYFRLGNGKIIKLDKTSADSDNDGLTDGEEAGLIKVNNKFVNDGIYGFNKEKGYWIVKSDPSKRDTDGDDIVDKEDIYDEDGNIVEGSKPAVTPDIIQTGGFYKSDKIFMDTSDVTYIHTSTYKGEALRGKSLGYVKNKYIENKDELRCGFDSILEWDILYSDDSDVWLTSDIHDTGFGALAIKNGNKIIIAFEGSTLKQQASFGDWIQTDGFVVLGGFNSNQVYSAYKFINRVMNSKDSRGCKIYITGHSLGGWLSQKVGGSILQGEENLVNISGGYWIQNQIPLIKKLEVKEMYNKTFSKRKSDISKIVTYAAPGFNEMTKIYNNASEVKNKVFNYKMNYDPVSISGGLELGNTRWCILEQDKGFTGFGQHPLEFYYKNYSYMYNSAYYKNTEEL